MWMLSVPPPLSIPLILILILILLLYCDCDYGWISRKEENIFLGFFHFADILATPIYIPYTPSVSRLTPLKVPLTHLKGAIFALNVIETCHFSYMCKAG